MLVMGEVHTGLLQNSGEISESTCRQVLALMAGETVRVSRRPIVHALSPERLTGVDCALPTGSRSRVRGVGTVMSRCAVTGGRVAQGSSYVRVVRSEADRRLPWSHYLARPGVVEVLGKAKAADLAEGFTGDSAPGGTGGACLNLGAVSGRFLDLVQASPLLDRRAPFKIPRTSLRWVAETGEPSIRFTLHTEQERTLRLTHPGPFTPAVVDLCEDLATHDWLLTSLLVIVERARIGGTQGAQAVARLAPAIDHLMHLWMPAARVEEWLTPFWESLERRPGFSRQWRSLVDRVRDQVAMNTLALLNATAEAGRR
ncbi:SCO2521 family protein [Microbispora bryophytorum]|uniref:SCO2521 family protein n=1 Tax=Microbispora bryophytorum TaxID=1460882 RepID=UPI0033D5F208